VPESQTVGLCNVEVNPPGPLQLYVAPSGLAEIVVHGSKQVIVPPVAEAVGGVRGMILPDPEPVHPFVSVTVTLYVPAVLVEIVDVVAPVLQA
jgi:hypothetical protein